MQELERTTALIQKGGSARETLSDAYNARGLARAALGDYDSAIDDYDAAIVFNPDEPIYYNNRGGLEDRVFRIKTDRSSATSLPEPRTGHNISNVEIVRQDGDLVEVRFNWLTMYYRYQNIDPYFGTSFYTLDVSGAAPLIKKKKVILKNDYIHHVVDIYHV